MLEKGGDGSASIENTVAPDPAQEPLKEPEVETETEVIQDEVSISKEATENSSPVRDAAVYDESQQDGNQQDGNQQDGNQQDGNQRNRNEEKNGGDDSWAGEVQKAPEFKLFIANMPMDYRKEDLEDLFQPYAPTFVSVAEDKFSGRHKGFAFISFDSEKNANEAIADLNGRDVDGKELKVEMSYNKPKPVYRDRPRGPRSNVCYAWRSGNCDRTNCRFDHFESDSRDSHRGGGGRYSGGYDRNRGFDRNRGYDRDRGYNRDRGYDRSRGYDRDRGYNRDRDNRRRSRSRSTSRSPSRGRY